MIYTDCTIKMNGNAAVPDRNLFIFKGGQNISINFKIVNNSYNLTKADEDDILKRTGANAVIIKIKRREGGYNGISEEIPVIDGVVTLELTQEIIECMLVGDYDYEFTLLDAESNSIMTLPTIKSLFHVKDKIFEHGHPLDTPGSTLNVALCNVSIAAFGLRDGIDEGTPFDEEGNYNQTIWLDGDLITDIRLNKIEEAIYEVNDEIKNFDFIDDVMINEEETTSSNTVLDFYRNGIKFKTIAFSNGNANGNAYISTSSDRTIDLELGADLTLPITFNSTNIGKGTLKITINNVLAKTAYIDQGQSETVIPASAFKKGENRMVVYVTDDLGVTSNSLTFIIRCGALELTSSFNSDDVYDKGSAVRYYFTPSAIDTSIKLTFHITIDGIEQTGVACTSGVRGYFTFPQSLRVGAHYCEAWISDGTKTSNKLTFSLTLIDNQSIVISSNTKSVVIEEGDQLSLDYKIFKKNEDAFNITVYVDDVEVARGTAGSTRSYYRTSSLKEGSHTIKIVAEDLLQTVSDDISWVITVTPSTYELVQPVVSSGVFLASAMNLTNTDEDKEIWKGRNQDGDIVNAYLYDFSYNENNGWIDDSLIITGTSYVEVPIQPLANNAKYGFTLDINFYTRAIGQEDAEVLRIWNDEKDCGILITTDQLLMRSASKNELNLFFSEEEFVNAIFVIDRDEKKAKIYLNGVMCGAFHLSDYSANGVNYLEDFTVNSNIVLGGKNKNGYCKIKSLRVYEVALATDEILTNFISCNTNKGEQKQLVEFQKGNTLPTLTIYCDFSGLGKNDKKPCNIVYNSTDEKLYGKSFTLEGKTSQLQYQGTSSMAYPIKNYRLNLRDKKGDKYYYHFPFGQPECRFTLKADFMSSGHWQNTGLTKWINDNLYHYDSKDAKSMNPKKWFDLQNGGSINDTRECIYGFPCRLILVNDGTTALNEGQNEPTPGNTKDMGIFNFNHDKDSTTTMGFDQDNFPNCASYEISANSDTSAGAFMSYDEVANSDVTELEYIKQSFELRFPDEEDVPEGWGFMGIPNEEGTGLKALIDWVDNCSDEEFVRDFEQHFHKDYTLRYYLLVIALGMVDNLGKNMMLDTWDNKIFMPRFYDCDTICSYDNSGDIKFDVDIEMEQGYWNTSSSRLWTRIRDLFHDELIEKYNDMRQNGLSYESLMKCFYDEQIAKIPQKYYNMDYDVKYAPFADGYMSMAHGDGYEHLKRWLKNRLIFTDSLFDYAPGYNNDMLTIRANTTDLMSINIETYTPVYQHVSWYNGQMDKKKIDGKNAVSFSGYSMTETDQEVLIYGGSNVKRITGISSMNPNQMLIGSATRLTELNASNSPLLEDINSNKANLLAHTYLNKVDLSNCSALGGNLRLDNSPLLQEINMSGTAITGINLPSSLQNLKLLKLDGTGIQKLTLRDNSLLTSLDLPATITELTLKDMRALRTIRWDGYSNLQKLSLENVQTDIATIMARADKIEAVRLINIDCQLAIVPMQKIMGLKGLDSNGNNIPIGQAVSGKIKLSSCTPTLENQLKTMFPLVEFTVLSYVSGCIVKFYDGNNELLYQEEVPVGGTATYAGPIPTKSSTAQYTYTFNGWSSPLGPINGNTTIRAEFTATLRYYTIRFLYPSTDELIEEQNLAYGDTPKPPVAGADYEGWTPAITTVTKDADYYAVPLPTPEDMTIFNLTEVTIDETSGYNCELLAVSHLPENLVFPGKYNGLPVLSISGSKSSTGKANIKTIVIPTAVKHIGAYTFYGCYQATSLNDGIKPLIESVGEYAFYNCTRMTGIWNLDNIKSIGSYAFYNFGNIGSVTEINLGDKCESIGDYAFQASKSEKYTWTNGLDVIGRYVFQNAKGVLHNTKHVKEILECGCGAYALSTASDDAWDGLEIIRMDAFEDATAKIFNNRLDVVIPNATLVESNAFSRLGVVRSISLPKVTVVQAQTVYACSTSGTTTSDDYLNYVSFGSPEHPVTAINSSAYASSSYGNFKFTHFITASGTLEGVTIDEANRSSFETYIKGVSSVFSKKSISRITDPNDSSMSYAIVDDEYAICIGLPYPLYGAASAHKNVTIPATVNSIPVTKLAAYIWYKGTYLETLTLPDTITVLPRYGFQGCSKLTSVTGATKIEHIGYYSFYNCPVLTTLGNALDVAKSFDSYAIYDCPKLKVAINNSAVTGDLSACVIYGTGVTSISFPNVTGLGNYCFYNNENLTELNLPKVSSLKGTNTFGGCQALTRINLPSLTTINKPSYSGSSYALFYNCTSLEYVTFGSKEHPVTAYAGLAGTDYVNVGMGHFFGCDNLKMVNMVTTNGLRSDVSFDNSSQFALEDRCMVFSTEPLNITNTAYVSGGFEYTLTDKCAILHSIPEGTTNISVDTISGLPVTNISARLDAQGPNGNTLETINCPNLRHISISMFNSVRALKNVSLPKAEYIGKRAFYDCAGLNGITLDFPEVSFVGHSAFYGVISCHINFSSKLKVVENALNNAAKMFYVFGGPGDPITNTSGWGNKVFEYFNSSTVADVTIYTTDGTKNGLTGSPWGKNYGSIIYLQA